MIKADFSGRVVLVTGGAMGIGLAICRAFAEAGARIACVDVDAAAGAAALEQLRGQGCEALFVEADVSDVAGVRRYVQATLDAFGQIDVFANNAGIEGVVLNVTDYPEEVFDKVMSVNVRGVFLGLKYVLPVMLSQGSGVVVNTGSTGSHIGATGVCAYIASKHAVLGLTRTAALEVAAHGIRINAICPGGTRTRLLQSLNEQRDAAAGLDTNFATPNGRIAEPEEIAGAVVYLASDEARHIIGQSLILDGGRLAM